MHIPARARAHLHTCGTHACICCRYKDGAIGTLAEARRDPVPLADAVAAVEAIPV
jgi:hypothetical protein